MTARDASFAVLGWQLAIAFRFFAELVLDACTQWRRARRTRTAKPTP